MLSQRHVHPSIPASDMDRARAWYEEKLGLTPSRTYPGAITYDCGGSSWFILYPTPSAGTAPHTLMGFVTDDIEAEVAELQGRGVAFEAYDYPNLKTDENGIASTPGPTRAAWFKDSEGNILGLVQLSE
jgi:catechol 2,3-dioxygenase-like lactoylglutathione lyase family enzyme